MIAILGGGISGLTIAHELKKANKAFILLEASAQFGGKIQSKQEQGLTFELGPNTVLLNNPEIKKLIQEIGLENELIFADNDAVKHRFVLKNNKIEAIPNSLKSAIKSNLFGFQTLANVLAEPFRRKRKIETDETLADFSRRRFSTQILDDFIGPFVSGIYAGDPEKMSVKYAMKLLNEAEHKHGSVIKGMMKIMKDKKQYYSKHYLPDQKIFTFKAGLHQLINSIASEIKDESNLNSRVKSIHQNPNGGYTLQFEDHEAQKKIDVNEIIACIPAFALSNIIQDLSPSLSKQLDSINYVPAVVCHFAFPKSSISFQDKAFGILSRRSENVPFLGILFNSKFFPTQSPPDVELLTVISGGYQQADLIDESEEDILSKVEEHIVQILGIKNDAIYKHLHRWKKGIPQYEIGYESTLNEINKFHDEHQNFYIASNYYGGISVSDCIANASQLAAKLN